MNITITMSDKKFASDWILISGSCNELFMGNFVMKKIQAHVTRMKLIPNVTQFHKDFLKIPEDHRVLGLIACDVENIMYLALDDATKKANVKAIYSLPAYTGRGNLWAFVRGQVVGMLTGKNVEDVRRGLMYAREFIEKDSELYTFDEDNSLICFVRLIPKVGKYYQEKYGIPEGMAVAQLVSSPVESTYALDKALKAGDVRIAELMLPPTRTNTGGAVVYGTYAACRAARDAFLSEAEYCFMNPMDIVRN